MTTDDSIAFGIKATAGVVTSAALVMFAVFSIFATLQFMFLKQPSWLGWLPHLGDEGDAVGPVVPERQHAAHAPVPEPADVVSPDSVLGAWHRDRGARHPSPQAAAFSLTTS